MKSIYKIIGKSENIRIEWKSSLSSMREIIETISAFSNTKGGKIIVGISDSGKIIGVQTGKGTMENIANQIQQNTEPKIYPIIEEIEIENKKIIIIEVTKYQDDLILANSRAYKRVGKSNRKISKIEYEKNILERYKDKIIFDKQLCIEADINQDINMKLVRWYLKERAKIRKIKKPIGLDNKHILINIGAANKIKNKLVPTNSGILCFGKNPVRFFHNSQLRLVRFKGTKITNSVLDRIDLSDSLFSIIEDAEDFIRKNIRLLSFRTDKSFRREDKFEYPIKALREAIINALIHRNYREPADTRVFIFDNRMEIINPGTFPKDVSPAKPVHKPVNPILCSLFYDVGLIEKYGSGIYMMNELCESWGNEKPKYEIHPVETKTIFFSQIKEKTIIKKSDKVVLYNSLSERQRNIINFLKKHNKITRIQCEKLLKINKKTAVRELNKLIGSDLVTKLGGGYQSYYTLT